LIKLTDFGLARFIDPSKPTLTTRCGSESYAAPELVTGQPYDGRATDAWACGVVLYALATRTLPFDNEPETTTSPVNAARARRRLLVRIASADYHWPCPEDSSLLNEDEQEDGPQRKGTALASSPGLRAVVARLLVRAPEQRSSLTQLWDDQPWMYGKGAPVAPALAATASGNLSRRGSGALRRQRSRRDTSGTQDGYTEALSRRSSTKQPRSALGLVLAEAEICDEPLALSPTSDVNVTTNLSSLVATGLSGEGRDIAEDEEIIHVEVEEHGALVDGDSIGDIARQELR
jgi:serine/threonine protein kinase